MPQCKTVRRTRKEICIGDMDTLITIQQRSIQEPDDFDFDELFTNGIQVWALHQVVGNKTIFDDTNIEIVVTDIFYINYTPSITTENWIELNGNRYDIKASPLDVDGRKEHMQLNCTIRGDKSRQVNSA